MAKYYKRARQHSIRGGGAVFNNSNELKWAIFMWIKGNLWQARLKPVFRDIRASQGPKQSLRRAIFYTLLYVAPMSIRRIFVMNPVDTFGEIRNPDLLPILVRFLVQEGTEDMARGAHNLYTSKTSSNELENKMCPVKIVARHMQPLLLTYFILISDQKGPQNISHGGPFSTHF